MKCTKCGANEAVEGGSVCPTCIEHKDQVGEDELVAIEKSETKTLKGRKKLTLSGRDEIMSGPEVAQEQEQGPEIRK